MSQPGNVTASDWVIRPYMATDEGFVVSSWLTSWSTSEYGQKWGAKRRANLAGGWWDEWRPVIMLLLRESTVRVLCDAGNEDVIWAWACTGGDAVTHYVEVKYSFKGELGGDMVRALLGDRLTREQVCSFEQRGLRNARIPYPKLWQLDEGLTARLFARLIERAA